MTVHIKTAGAAMALILLAAAGAAGCGDSGGVAASVAREAADQSHDALPREAQQAGLRYSPAMAGQLPHATLVQNIDAALEGLDESRALEIFDAACAEALPDFFESPPDPQDQGRVDEVASQLPDPATSPDTEQGLEAWAMCEVRSRLH